jgi:hypothetical protein
MEFQPRRRRPVEQQHAPHVHLYVGLPDVVSEEEYTRLVARTLHRRRLEREVGKYAARAQVRAPRGDFADWLVRSWFEIVGSGNQAHRYRGVDVTAVFWSDDAAAQADRVRIAEYFWRESGKFGQKAPPDGFGGLAFYGRWGGKSGFLPVEGARQVEAAAFFHMRRVYRRLVVEQLRREAAQLGELSKGYRGPRGRDGLTVFLSNAPAIAARVEAWAEETAIGKTMREVTA